MYFLRDKLTTVFVILATGACLMLIWNETDFNFLRRYRGILIQKVEYQRSYKGSKNTIHEIHIREDDFIRKISVSDSIYKLSSINDSIYHDFFRLGLRIIKK